MTANSKDRQTWRKIPRDAVEEARRRVGLNTPNGDDDSPPTRTSWLPSLPSLRLPGVRRTSTKVIEDVKRIEVPPAPVQQPRSSSSFRGIETLPWQQAQQAQHVQPGKPTQAGQPAWQPAERERGPVIHANVLPAAGAAPAPAVGVALAETVLDPVVIPAPARQYAQSGEREKSPYQDAQAKSAVQADAAMSLNSRSVPSVKAALAAIDAAASHRSARLHSVAKPTPNPQSMSAADIEKYAAVPVQEPAPMRAPSPQPQAMAPQAIAPQASLDSSPQRHPMRSPSLTAAPEGALIPRAHGGAAAAPLMLAVRDSPPPIPAPVPAPAYIQAQPAPAAMVQREAPFRANAMRAKVDDLSTEPLPEVTGSGWTVLLVLTTLLGLGLGLAYVGHVEQTSIANGVLQVRGGPRPVLALTSGPVLTMEVVPGDVVHQGQTIARIDATDLNAREQRDVAQLAMARTERERIGAAELSRLQAEQRALRQKRTLLEERARLKGAAVRDRRERMEQVQHAAHAGVATQGDALAVREAERSAAEELLLIRQQVTETDLQLTDAHKNYQATLERLRHEIDSATNSLAETRTLLQTTEIKAPVAGRVESLQVTQGQVVSSGAVLARIVPEGAITSAVVFAPAKDASFLREGLDANLEFASLPVSEFGKTTARVTRVSKDVASADEIMSALGHASEEPVIRVELELVASEQLTRVQDKLRSGERLTARLNTRDRRMIALLFEFLRKWYEP
jgi:multidrug resistance efflux pump